MDKNYEYILKTLKDSIRSRRQKASIAVNEQLLHLYWEIGKTILDQQKAEGWGAKIIKRLASDLKSEFADMKGISERNLKYMRVFAEAYPSGIVQAPLAQIETDAKGSQNKIVQPPVAQLNTGQEKVESDFVQPLIARIPWSHHIILLEKVKDIDQRVFYINKTIENGWSRNVLKTQIESQLHLRQGAAITNFKEALPDEQSDLAIETIKSPYVFDFLSLGEQMREKDLENALISNMKKFLLELGKGFAYVGNQYNLEVEGNDYFLDLLFYNTKLHCYVVFELKVGEFKPEYAGKLNFYVNTVDAQIKTEKDAPTMGVMLCKTPNKTIIEYSLKGVEKPLGVADYQLSSQLPEDLKTGLPTVQELEEELEKEIEIPISPLEQKLAAIRQKAANLKRDPVKEEKSPETIKRLIEQFLYPLDGSVRDKSKELGSMFKQNQGYIRHSHQGFIKREEFEQKLSQDPEPNQIGLEYSFSGFISAGTQAFNVYQEFTIKLKELKYDIHFSNRDNPDQELLYHEIPSKVEIETWAERIVDGIASQISDRLDGLDQS